MPHMQASETGPVRMLWPFAMKASQRAGTSVVVVRGTGDTALRKDLHIIDGFTTE